MRRLSTSIKLTFLACLISQQFYSQTNYPKDYFRSPMDIPLVLAGNFAELRSNHFHTGLDLKTNGKEGYKLYAIADGYISRINVSHWGYGLCIYVKHPNGYTSVYAHCSKFTKEVEDFVKKAQRKKETEQITLYPGAEQFPLKKGDIVSYSGNSGSSTAPHLHFEIRDSKTEKPINPLLFGFDIKDNIAPSIFDIKLYSIDGGNIAGKNQDKIYPTVKGGKTYNIQPNSPVEVNGKIGVAINTIDRLNVAPNKCGVYHIELQLDDKVIYQHTLEKLDFYTNRYINAHMDYLEYRYKKESFHKSFILENNKLPIYGTLVNDGYITINDDKKHQLKYTIKDAYGNSSVLNFELKGNQKLPIAKLQETQHYSFDASSKNQIITDDFKAFFPKGAIYQDEQVNFKETKTHPRAVSKVFDFHTDSVPLQKYFVLKMKLNSVKPEHRNKALIAELSNDRRRLSAKGGSYRDGWVSSKVRSFGNYLVALDTIPPNIVDLNLTSKKYKVAKKLLFKITDNLSGIDSYKVFIDGKFFHSKYTPRSATLRVLFDEYNPLEPGKHKVKVVVIDERKNKSESLYDIEY